MVKQEIVAGLKASVARGEDLQNAMMSFFNAGYSKKDIQEAVDEMNMQKFEAQTQPSYVKEKKPVKKIAKKGQAVSKVSGYGEEKKVEKKQKISGYGEAPKSRKWIWIILLIILLSLLIASLVGIIFFEDKVWEILGKIRGR
jgi:hypothetical protein